MWLFKRQLNKEATKKMPVLGYVTSNEIYLDKQTAEKLKEYFIVIDTETTGLDPATDRIIEIAAIKFKNGKAVDKYSSLINTGVENSSGAYAVNQISQKMLNDAPKEDRVYKELFDFFGEASKGEIILSAYNANFDIKFLSEAFRRNGFTAHLNFIDVYRIARDVLPHQINYKQDTIAKYFCIDNPQQHRAEADAKTCGYILLNLLDLHAESDNNEPVDAVDVFTDEELAVCAFIQDTIQLVDGDTEWIRFHHDSKNYVCATYFSTFIKFRFGKKGKYIIVKRKDADEVGAEYELCPKSEGGDSFCRVFFEDISELKKVQKCIACCYSQCLFAKEDYFNATGETVSEAKKNFSWQKSLSKNEVKMYLKLNSQITSGSNPPRIK